MPTPLSTPALDTLRRAKARLIAWPSLTLWLACIRELPEGDKFTCAELDEALQASASHDLMGADAVDRIMSILEQLGATIPAPAPTEECPVSIEITPEDHLRAALEHLTKAIDGFGPCPATYRLEFARLDLQASVAALDLASTLEAEKEARHAA